MSYKLYWIWLTGVSGIGPKRFRKLLERFESPEGVWNAPDSELLDMQNTIGEKYINEIISCKTDKELEKADRILNTPDVKIYTLISPEYPMLLKNIYDPPPVLYIKGKDLESDMPAVAVVGSRHSSEYGRIAARNISRRLAEAGVCIVSGLARGIDTYAHKGALDAQSGYTVAVIGCGVDIVYPPENKKLFNDIAERGTIVTEYPHGTQPTSGNFPARNRIISGLSKGVLVVEAGLRSGALITVDYALEQGRDVYAMPGNINSPYSVGTNKLLKEGAKLVTGIDDILEELSFINNKACKNNGNNDDMQFGSSRRHVIELDFFEAQVYNALQDGNKDIDQLINIIDMEPGRLNALLTMMEIKGIIKQLPGKIFMSQWKD